MAMSGGVWAAPTGRTIALVIVDSIPEGMATVADGSVKGVTVISIPISISDTIFSQKYHLF